MKLDWRKLSWKAAKAVLMKVLQSSLKGVAGPISWVALEIGSKLLDGYVKPYWQVMTRKFRKKKKEEAGQQQAEVISEISEDNPDDVFDSMHE